jgi:hypothetical protein
MEDMRSFYHFYYVIARRALALPDEAIPNYEETASAKNKCASQRHDSFGRFTN